MDDKNTELILNTLNSMKSSIDSMQNTIGSMQNAIGSMQSTISSMQNYMDKKFDAIDQKFDTIDKKFDTIDKRFDAIDKRFDSIDGHLALHDEEFKNVKEELASLGHTTARIEAEIGTKAQIGLEYASIAMEKFDHLQETTDNINSKLDTHNLHIEVLEEKVL